MISNLYKKLSDNSKIILVYIVLALFFTFPLITNITDSLATGKNRIENDYTINSDTIYFLWNIWFFKYNLLDIGKSPFSYTDMVFYPSGFDVSAGGYDNVFNSLLSLPFQIVLKNLVLVFNILVLFNFVFAAYSAYLLANYIIKDKKISFLSGIIFGFSPYMMARSLGHFNLLTTGAISLFILFYLKMLKKPHLKNAIGMAISFFLVTISAWQYGLFMGIFIVLSSIYFTIRKRKCILNSSYLKNFIIFGVLSILLLLPVVFPIFKSTLNGKSIPSRFEETIMFSADPFSYITPMPLNYFFGSLVNADLYKTFSSFIVESTTFLGYLELAIIFFCFKQRNKLDKKIKYWLYLFTAFFILSLGPYLKIARIAIDEIPLPYYYLIKYVPFFNFAKEPVRLSVFVALSASILCAFALKYFSYKKEFASSINPLIIIIAIIIITERTIFPYPIEKVEMPQFYREIAEDKSNYAIIDLPIDSIIGFSLYNYYQTIHQKKMVSGKIMPYAFSKDTYSFIKNDIFLSQSTCIFDETIKDNPYTKNNNAAFTEKMIKNNIKYLVIHKDMIDYFEHRGKKDGREYDCQPLKNNLNILFDQKKPIYEDNLIKVYNINQVYID